MALGLEQAIAEHLNQNGFGDLYDGTTPAIFIFEEPDTPLNAITVIPEAGAPPTAVKLQENHGISVRVRRQEPEAAFEVSRDIYVLLHETDGLFKQIAVAKILAVTSAPIALGRERVGPDAGGYRTTQSFSVNTKRFAFQ